MSAKFMSRIAIMSALCVVLRMVFISLPNVQPVTAFLLSYLLYFGLAEAVLVMMLCLFLSAFLLGFGPWVFWQVTCFVLVLLLWRFVLYPLSQQFPKYQLGCQAFLVALCGLLYGVLIDTCFAYLYSMPWWSYVLAGMPFNIAHALSTLVFFPVVMMLFRRLISEQKI
ncbi:TPA: ECF transporter S component [Streptococcus pyogenes]|uniref:ECF transporter S component n=2 Tax=Streptococcus pyogenes TaxID=1314 RepID=A0A5S4TPE8_STRPY|nr:ECF transporter S component [Streptococcus pyogenes]ERL09076.1 ECF-type riboflavin transporter, S component [Streptococcus pyogenes GA06023]ESU86298.1 ECF-type riboflavin transporter, S component [Streptococcus pyogenes GA03455]HEP6167456.1 ECF transporter S component [Streptococcus pyogenes ABC020047934]HEP6169391.1 ECF transporter S component [Streptococcus pyogenes ABC020030174]HEP6170950.1 ECF transporter S component [Streptococcus pyogenes ABC020055614]HEP6172947.1 ECF transporter S c